MKGVKMHLPDKYVNSINHKIIEITKCHTNARLIDTHLLSFKTRIPVVLYLFLKAFV